jgi:tRNA 2-thiouridine synthesizing protein C
MNSSAKSILILCRRAPYGTSLARGAIELALAASAFDQKVALIFTGDGVWQLLSEQDSATAMIKNHGKLLSALPLYDIGSIYIDAESCRERNIALDKTLINPTAIEPQDISAMMEEFDTIFNF